MFDLINSILAIVTILLATFGLGRPLLRKLAIAEDDLFANIVWSLALGLVATGWLFSLLALCGCLYSPLLMFFTLAGGFWGLGEIVCSWLAWRTGSVIVLSAKSVGEPIAPAMPAGIARILCALACAAAAGALISALAPPTSPEGLDRCLALSKTILLAHGVAALPDGDLASGPLMIQMWYAWALALDGPVAAGLLHWTFGLLMAAAAVLLARPLLGRRGAWVAGAIVLLSPGISYQMGASLDDLALAMFTTLLVVAWRQSANAEQQCNWLITAGIMAGAAAGTKLTGLVFTAAVLVVSLAFYPRRARSQQVSRRPAIDATEAAFVIGGLWYLWAAQHGTQINTTDDGSGAVQQIGALLIAVLPGLLLVRQTKGVRPLVYLALVYALSAAACVGNLRWWAPLVPLLAVGAAIVWREIVPGEGFARRLTQIGLVSLAISSAAMPLMRAKDHVAVAFGWQSREDYLVLHQSIYRAALLANQLMRPGDRILSQDPHTFYFSYPAADARAFRPRADNLAGGGVALMSRQLRSAGFTHVLLAEPASLSAASESDLGAKLERELAQRGEPSILPLAEYFWTDSASVARRYRLVKLR